MPVIKVVPSGQECEYVQGATLLETLLNNDVYVENPCGGMGLCGKCRVRIVAGDAGEMTETERKYLGDEEIADGIRLACLVEPESDLTVEVNTQQRKHKVLTSGYVPEFKKELDIVKHTIQIHKPTLEDQTPFEDQILNQIPGVEFLTEVPDMQNFEEGIYTAVIHLVPVPVNTEVLHSADRSTAYRNVIVALEQGDTTDKMYGCAIDIGTTTVVTSLVDMITGDEIATASMINAQKTYGLDVLTRITYEVNHPETGIQELQKAIVDSINDMIAEVCSNAGIDRKYLYELAVGANCTMMHTLLGVDARAIGVSPYAPMFVRAKNIEAARIGIEAAPGARLYCLPSTSSYIGADIVAGAYVCGLHEAEENVLFIDIGTNGEIVFSDHGKLLSCSCAAGPALEGMNISSGMRAAEGAIEDVEITEEEVKLKVIGDQDPVGVCGSGILTVVKELVRTGIVTKNGAFVKPKKLEEDDYRLKYIQMNGVKREFVMCREPEELLITQGDVRQVQLAKGAILSGFYALIKKAGKTMEELDKVMIAGQFGAHLPVDSLIGVGILPEAVRGKIEYVGNTSKTGAYMALMSRSVKHGMEELAHHMDYMELGATENYERLFAECLNFADVSLDDVMKE